MPAGARTNLGSGPTRRSPRLKNIQKIYDEDSDRDSSAFKPVKTEAVDLEEIASPSISELIVAFVSDKDCEQVFHNVSLKDLRARCKVKKRKDSKIMCGGPSIQTEKTIEEFGLDKPLIAFKHKRQKCSLTKANGMMDVLTSSPCAVKVEDTKSEREETPSPAQNSPLDATMHDSATEKLERRAIDLEQSTIAIGCTKDIVGEEVCCVEVENTAGGLASCEYPDILCEMKTEDIEFGTSSYPKRNCSEHSSFELQQEKIEDDGCGPQPCFMDHQTELPDVSEYSSELICSAKAYSFDGIISQKADKIVSSLDFMDEGSNHQKTLDNITNSGMDKSSSENGFVVCSLNQSFHDHSDIDENLNPEVVEGNAHESVKIFEELSPIDECGTDMGSPSVAIKSDLCENTEINCSSFDEAVQMQADGQLDSIFCRGVKTKQPHMETEHGATDYTFAFDKTLGLAQTPNFAAQDGRLESIVYDALNNHAQNMTSANKSSVRLPNTSVLQSSVIDFNDNCPDEKRVSNNGKILLPNNVEWSPKDMNKFNSTVDYAICKSVNNEGSEEFVLQPQFFQACVDKEKTGNVTSKISNPDETQEIPTGAPNAAATSAETDGQKENSEHFIDGESIEEHGPKKLLSKRKIMSPTSQEKLCNAMTGIDLCNGVQRLKRKTILECCDKIKLTQPIHKEDGSMFSTDKRLKGKTCVSPTSKGVLKSAESPSHQQTTCSCMRSSSVVLDTEKAVEFSQRQMLDIDNIAAKLIRSLKHMKSIVDESLSSEAYSLLPNFNIAEIRAASEDALEVEKTTRKWLSIMNKDCNRFCKILALASKNTVSHPEAPRKQRKITFADEAGGKLCHVKVFKDGQTSLVSECQSDL